MDSKLSAPLSVLKGVGPGRFALLEKLGLRTIGELLWFFPRRYEDRRNVRKISDLVPGAPSVVIAKSLGCEARSLGARRRIIKCRLTDGSGTLEAVWFNIRNLENSLKEGQRVALFGVPSIRGSQFEMGAPEYEILKDDEGAEKFTGIFPIYPSTAGLPKKWFCRTAASAVKTFAPLITDPLPPEIIKKRDLIPLCDAIREMHAPGSPQSWKEARRRIAYGELLALRLEIESARAKRAKKGAAKAVRGSLYQSAIENFPFEFTDSQKNAIDELIESASSGAQSARLLQGDVGCGKSAVAIAFAAAICDGGTQCAVLAPTELLAEQLYSQIKKYIPLKECGCALLKSSTPQRERRQSEAALSEGRTKIAVGTHALLSEKIKFHNLGAVIIDEQQRFGVRQRAKLLCAAPRAHLLMMSATPIPRTTALALYGDLDITIVDSLPAGRAPVETRIVGYEKMTELLRFIAREIIAGGRVYWICPRVEESECPSVSAARRREWLAKKLPPVTVALVYGQMESKKKERALSAFRDGESTLLVGTTVLEVGVDVPEATVIVIESPERYGLSQLHQLRGRVGRGTRRGLCVLLSDEAKSSERLKKFSETRDGFAIARADLELRGAGELTGIAQHGDIGLRVADLARDAELAQQASEDARELALNSFNLMSSNFLSSCCSSRKRT